MRAREFLLESHIKEDARNTIDEKIAALQRISTQFDEFIIERKTI